MLEIFRGRAVKASIIRIIVAIIIIVGIQGITKVGIIDYLRGPVKLDTEKDMESYLGKYVTYDTEYIAFGYMDTIAVSKKLGAETLSSSGFVVLAQNGKIFAIDADVDSHKEIEAIIDQTSGYIFEDSGILPESFRATGTLEKLSGEELGFYNDAISEAFGSDYELNYPYVIKCGEINGFAAYMILVLNIVAAIALLYAIYIISSLLKNTSGKHIQNYLDENKNVSMSEVESDFRNAKEIGKDAWSGRRWTFYYSGIYGEIISNRDIVWAYYFQRTGKRSESSVKIFTKDKTEISIDVSEELAKELLEEYVDKQPHIFVGYDSNVEKTFKKEFDTFLTYKYNEGIAATEDPFFNSDKYAAPSFDDTEKTE